MLVDKNHSELSIAHQCDLLGLSRSGYYYRPKGLSDEDLLLMRLIDQEYTRHPFYGSRRLRDSSRKDRISAIAAKRELV